MPKVVAVTGISGYIASVLAKQLLDEGNTVHGTVRSLKNEKKVKHLNSLSKKGKLLLFEADLLKEGSFKECFKGVEVVFHTASPFFMGKPKDAQKELVDPALKGTENVVNQAQNTPTVKQIIVTSSVASVAYGNDADPITEKDWSKLTIEAAPYPFSKLVAEKKAWKLNEKFNKGSERKVKMNTVCPSAVIGPGCSTRMDATSVQFFAGVLFGKIPVVSRNLRFFFVDVRDVAAAHVALMKKDVEGRVLASGDKYLTAVEIAKTVKKLFPQFPVTSKFVGEEKKNRNLDNSKVRKLLGRELIPIEKSYKDWVAQFVAAGIIPTKK